MSKLTNIFVIIGTGILKELKNGITDSQNNLKENFLGIFTQFSQGNIEGGIMTFNDVLSKNLNIKDKNEIQYIINALNRKNLLYDNGAINTKLLFDNPDYVPKNIISLKIIDYGLQTSFGLVNNNNYISGVDKIRQMINKSNFYFSQEKKDINYLKKNTENLLVQLETI